MRAADVSNYRDAIESALLKYAEAIHDLQSSCTHERVGEKPYVANTYFNDTPPKRICLDCGLIETGWSFKVLTPRHVYKFTENDFDQYMIKKCFYVKDEE